MKYIDAIADFLQLPNSRRAAATRLLVFIILSCGLVALARQTPSSTSAGFLFGYLWGGLTVYGTMRRRSP